MTVYEIAPLFSIDIISVCVAPNLSATPNELLKRLCFVNSICTSSSGSTAMIGISGDVTNGTTINIAIITAHNKLLFLEVSTSHYSKKSLNFLERLGCLNFLKAFASICLIRSLVTPKSLPTSSRVRLLPSSNPNLS